MSHIFAEATICLKPLERRSKATTSSMKAKIFRERRFVWHFIGLVSHISVLLVSPPQIENDPIRRANLRFEVASLGRRTGRYVGTALRSPAITSPKEEREIDISCFALPQLLHQLTLRQVECLTYKREG